MDADSTFPTFPGFLGASGLPAHPCTLPGGHKGHLVPPLPSYAGGTPLIAPRGPRHAQILGFSTPIPSACCPLTSISRMAGVPPLPEAPSPSPKHPTGILACPALNSAPWGPRGTSPSSPVSSDTHHSHGDPILKVPWVSPREWIPSDTACPQFP